MLPGFPFGAMLGSAAAWTPANLFASGEEGAWYDPSDLSTLWQDTAGTTAVTTDGQAVARIDDKSGNGWHATQDTEANRPLYKTAGLRHWLEFDGANDQLQISASFSMNLVAAAAFRHIASQTGFRGVIASRNVSSLGAVILLRTTTDARWATFGSGTTYFASTTLTVGQDYVACVPTLNSGTFRLNGADDGTYSATDGQTSAHIGGLSGQLSNIRFYGGILVSDSLAGAELASVEGWLAYKAQVSI